MQLDFLPARLKTIRYPTYFLCAILSLTIGCATLPENYVSLNNRTVSSLEEIMDEISNKKVIFLGEGHDIKEDHLVQFEVIRRLHERGKDMVIALEMFPSEAQPALNQWIGGKISENDFKKNYYSVWHVPYEYYSKIFEYARRFKIPLAGINGDETLINNVAKTGIEKLPKDFRRAFRVASCDRAPQYRRMIDLFESEAGHASKMPFLCDAQLLRDSLMAYNIMAVLERGRFTVVVLVGSIHALRAAVPGILARHYNVTSSVLVSKRFADIVSPDPDAEVADYMWY
jgi:aminopeptidase N